MQQLWHEQTRELAFKKYSRKIEKVVFRLPDGTESDFYVKAEGPAAAVLALTPDNLVILVKEYRPGPKLVLDELPGGYVDPNEQPEQTIRREFIEETGYDGDFELVNTCLDDAYSTMVRYCYVAKNCHKVGKPTQTATESTEVVLVPLKEFRERLRSGKMTDIEVGYMCLDYLGLLC